MTVPVKRYQNCFLGSYSGFCYNYNEVKHILELVYINVLVKQQYQSLFPYLAELWQKKLLFAYAMVGH